MKAWDAAWAIFKTLQYAGGGGIMASPCNFAIFKVEEQNLLAWGILMSFFKEWH